MSRGSHGAAFVNTDREGLLLAPPLRLRADRQSFVSIIMTARHGQRGTLFFAAANAPGLHSYSFPIRADGREPCYNLDMLAAPDWRGQIVALALRPSDAAAALPSGDTPSRDPAARLRSSTVSDRPAGPPDLAVLAFALDQALPRAGAPAAWKAIVTNKGGQTATNLQAELRLPPGMRLIASTTHRSIRTLGFDEEAAFSWSVQADKPLRDAAQLTVWSDDGGRAAARTTLDITAPVATRRFSYVPEPQPVRGPCEVGVYYFPRIAWP
jgi:uncharacterized repeat protein (TIGR01451 family)